MTATESNGKLRCSISARARGDSMVATASPAQGFLLIEEPGSWGINAMSESALDPVVTHRVAERAAAAAMRALLIRRPVIRRPGHRQSVGRRRWFVVDSRPGKESVRSGFFDNDHELLHLQPADPAGEAHLSPLYLICTHGRHDTCCAVEGRPVAAALAAQRPDETWECSHLGGDRFAANLLVLPHGLTYGHVDATSVVTVVESYERGEIEPAQLRGRSALPAPAQAAEHFVRAETGDRSLNAMRLGLPRQGDDGWYVEIDSPSGSFAVVVRAVADPPPAIMTCRAVNLGMPRHYELVSLSSTDRNGPAGSVHA
jgi:hypothetical protein